MVTLKQAARRLLAATRKFLGDQPVAYRHSFDGYGWLYIDNGHGSDWEDRARQYPDAEPLYE